MPIVMAPKGVELRITKILLDGDRLAELTARGIAIDTRVTVAEVGEKEIVLTVAGKKIALDIALGTKILVA